MEATQRNGSNGSVSEPLVMVRTEDGFRVYSPTNPGQSHLVAGGPENPTCTCSDFQQGQQGELCAHIKAVLDRFGRGNGAADTDNYAREERLAIQGEGRVTPASERQAGPSTMLLKRSVSPDGRIDSLSVEFSTEVDGMAPNEVVDRALRLLSLQSAIAKSFLAGAKNGNGIQQTSERREETSGAVLAEMVGIGGMDGKWGRRLFIRIQSNGQSLRFFGNKSQLADAFKTAGFPRMAERIDEGLALRVPCRVITKRSEDGRYLNVERILPIEMPNGAGGNGR